MKWVISFSFLGFVCACTPTQAAPTAAVTQIQFAPGPVLRDQEIKNISQLNDIVSAGRYAWAVGDGDRDTFNKVAFYDGHQWSTAVAISGNRLLPLYPTTGNSPLAAMYSYADNTMRLFDGANWGQPISLNFISSGRDCQINAAGGYVYVMCAKFSSNDFVFSVYNSKTSSWTSPVSVPGDSRSFDTIDIGDDSHPTVFLKVNNGVTQIVQLLPNGTDKVMPLTQGSMSDLKILVGKTHVFAIASEGMLVKDLVHDSDFTFYKGIPFSALSHIDIAPGAGGKNEENNGVLCPWDYDWENIKHSVSCFDANAATPSWTPLLHITDLPISYWEEVSNGDGPWLGIKLGINLNGPSIFKYNASTNSLIDTGFQGSKAAKTILEGTESGGLLACQYSPKKTAPSSLFYYDISKTPAAWSAVKLTIAGQASNCAFSPDNRSKVSAGGSIWLYRDTRIEEPTQQKMLRGVHTASAH